MVRRRIVVHGRVQGVFFRATARDVASKLGVTGWIANQPDGTVMAEVEGPERAVRHFEAWCGHGPPRAAVESVDADDVPPTGESGFRVL